MKTGIIILGLFFLIACAHPNRYRGTFSGSVSEVTFHSLKSTETGLVLHVDEAKDVRVIGKIRPVPVLTNIEAVLLYPNGKLVSRNSLSIENDGRASVKGKLQHGRVIFRDGTSALQNPGQTNVFWSGMVLRGKRRSMQ